MKAVLSVLYAPVAVYVALRFFWVCSRWRRGKIPSFSDRRFTVLLIERASPNLISVAEHIFGPGMIASITGKSHRRRIVVWKIHSAETAIEKIDRAIRMGERLLAKYQ